MAEALWRLAKTADDALVQTILGALQPLGASNAQAFNQLDEGLADLLSESRLPLIAAFAEAIVEHHAFPADLKSLDSLTHKLTSTTAILRTASQSTKEDLSQSNWRNW